MLSKQIEVPKDVRHTKSGNMTSSGENGLNIRTPVYLVGCLTQFCFTEKMLQRFILYLNLKVI